MSGRKKKKHEHVNHERWLVSYADFITLLFAFFVVMFAVSQVDSNKLGRFVESVNVAFQFQGIFPPNQGSPLTGGGGSAIVAPVVSSKPSFLGNPSPSPRAKAIRESLEEKLRQAGLSGDVELRNDPRGVVVSLPERSYFLVGTATVRPDARDKLRQVAAALHDEPGAVQVEAHTDDLEISSALFVSNWELSAARAARVVRFLIEEEGFEPERMSAAGLAETRPLVENTSEESREQNRRVDLVIVTEGAAAGG